MWGLGGGFFNFEGVKIFQDCAAGITGILQAFLQVRAVDFGRKFDKREGKVV